MLKMLFVFKSNLFCAPSVYEASHRTTGVKTKPPGPAGSGSPLAEVKRKGHRQVSGQQGSETHGSLELIPQPDLQQINRQASRTLRGRHPNPPSAVTLHGSHPRVSPHRVTKFKAGVDKIQKVYGKDCQ